MCECGIIYKYCDKQPGEGFLKHIHSFDYFLLIIYFLLMHYIYIKTALLEQ